MIKLFFLIVFLFMNGHVIKAEETPGEARDFMNQLDKIKNPFEDGIPEPVVVVIKPVYHPKPKPKVLVIHKYRPIIKPQIALPRLRLQGVIVGEDMHQAIINDQPVPIGGNIMGARVESISKRGVELIYRGKKFFLKID